MIQYAILVLALATNSFASIRQDKVHVTDAKKTNLYIQDGMFVGGDRAIDGVVVKDIRRAANDGFDRFVIDLEGSAQGDAAAIQRPPYYQVSVTADEERMLVTLWGKPKLNFDAKKVIAQFKKSSVVSHLELLPKLDPQSWTFVMGLKGNRSVEVFELSNPVRIIIDVRGKK